MNAPDEFPNEHIREVPHSVEMEQSVLGALLLNNEAIDMLGGLRSEHFFRYEHRLLFETIQKMIVAGRTADVVTVYEHLQTAGHVDRTGGLPYLNALANNTPGSANVARYAQIVIDRWKLRGILAAADEIGSMAYNRNGMEVSEIIALAQSKFEPLAESRASEPRFIGEYLAPVVEEIDEQSHGAPSKAIPTGFRDLDWRLDGGMNDGELFILAGRPSMGKTALAMAIAMYVAECKGTVLVFSMEMPGKQLTQRGISLQGGIPLPRIKNGSKMTDEDWPRLTSAVAGLAEMPLLLDESAGLSLAEITSRARAAKRKHGLKLIVVDYLQLMTGGEGEGRTQQVGSYSRGLKSLAKNLGVPVIALAQLNRGLEARPNKRPLMSDLRDSGEIEQDADTILFLYRDEVYNPDSPDKGVAEVIIGKQRNGALGVAHLAFIGEHAKFGDLQGGYIPVPRTKPRQQRGFEE
ncbi:replicative DNA helicase [Paraburkholderia rhynchosiae]|uniref:Replicative DNA helicase n=1 Tax=Paraburkholderia rhynchosiae TaxID=487049 RepID=A0A2N7W997_9BURK|nr:replicative DNA helicase [Paraburkholderia rhynchosiae]PMS25977.1 replicative DNA helicase [Paraburkholderia rhynchosiae]CAB3730719.1 Replicative DNA helicase [Paraburkholderia rhynchosiae]